MTDDARGNRHSRTTNTRWSLFEPLGHEDGYDDGRGDAGHARDGSTEAADAPLDPLLVAVAGELRRPVKLHPELDDRIMALVASEPRPRREVGTVGAGGNAAVAGETAPAATAALVRAWNWLRRPRLVSLTPLGGLGAVAGLAALLLVAVRMAGTDGQEAAVAAPMVAVAGPDAAPDAAPAVGTADSIQVVQFVLVAPGAQTVVLVGDFNDWQAGATPLRAVASGRVWTVEVPLTTGRHRYAFVVDDESWVPDPSAPRAPGDDFGTPSSVVTVAERRS